MKSKIRDRTDATIKSTIKIAVGRRAEVNITNTRGQTLRVTLIFFQIHNINNLRYQMPISLIIGHVSIIYTLK